MTNQALNHIKGLKGEEIACHYLVSQGYTLLAKRYKKKGGEIDLILKKDDMYIFVEVRVRKNFHKAAESVDLKKQRRLTQTATHFIMQEIEHGRSFAYCRFDVVLINASGQLQHIENAFEVNDA